MFTSRTFLAAALCVGIAALAPGGWTTAGAQGGQSLAPETMSGAPVPVRADPRVVRSFVPARVQPRLQDQAGLVTITVIYTGFTPQAQAAFQHAVDLWASQLTSTVPLRIEAQFTALAPGVLGSAGPVTLIRNATGLPPNTWYAIGLANKIAGVDLLPASNDIRASFSNSFSWYYGTDGNAPAGTYDFVSVVMHELCHGLGFIGSASVSGGNGSWGSGGFPYVYDQFTENGAGQPIISFVSPSAALGMALTSMNVFFDGPATRRANGGNPARLYAPGGWQAGSSYSHFDEATFAAGNPNSLMTPQIASREAIHDPGPVGRGLLEDIGWTVGQVPTLTMPGNLRIVP
jgi:hypothetical protein